MYAHRNSNLIKWTWKENSEDESDLKTASGMTYTVSGGALNSVQPQPSDLLRNNPVVGVTGAWN